MHKRSRDRFASRTEALIRFRSVRHGRCPTAETRLTMFQKCRVRLMLQAVDGRLSGAKYRETTAALFERGRIDAEAAAAVTEERSVVSLMCGL
ncbi:MAG: DUF2285 domain-containing protein [Rhizobiales bacterium]|nr:DUF2285 domain-containing protein [Hyphomicrobiales bacterium]